MRATARIPAPPIPTMWIDRGVIRSIGRVAGRSCAATTNGSTIKSVSLNQVGDVGRSVGPCLLTGAMRHVSKSVRVSQQIIYKLNDLGAIEFIVSNE